MIKRITIIGSGNVATALAKAFVDNHIQLVQVFSRKLENAQKLINQLDKNKKIEAICDLKNLSAHTDCLIIAVKDDAIAEVVKQLPFSDKLTVHTSGSVGITVFKNVAHFGVFYPVQTFSKTNKTQLKTVPFCIEGNSELATNQLVKLAEQLTNNVHRLNSEQRKALHLAAVFACNFSNYMYVVAEQITSENNIDFSILKPLILETAKKIEGLSPKEAQTGPAKRKDIATINEQLQLLKNDKALQDLYQLVSNKIMDNQ